MDLTFIPAEKTNNHPSTGSGPVIPLHQQHSHTIVHIPQQPVLPPPNLPRPDLFRGNLSQLAHLLNELKR
ncbi:hypothetical protein Hanom_Chr03g00201051 [Helianthus anomalus]